MAEDTLKIHILINGVKLPLTVKREDEEIYRTAERLVMKFINDYQRLYHHMSYTELLTLVAFRLAVVFQKKENSENQAPIAERIQMLDNELQQLLEERA